MAKALTTRRVEAVKPDPERRYELPDPALRGLYLVVQPSGAKSWALRYRYRGRPRKLTLGKWPVVGVGAARAAATDALEAIEMDGDPAADKKAARGSAANASDMESVAALFEAYSRRHLAQLRTGRHVHRELERHVVAHWGTRSAKDITRADIHLLLDNIVDSGRETTANRVRAYLGKWFSWMTERGYLDTSPMVGIKAPAKEKTRDRVLTDHEIRWLWLAADRLDEPWGPVAQMLLLTGQRLGEVLGMTSGEIEGDLWLLPAHRVKNGRPHSVPLSPPALAIIQRPDRVESDFIFSATGGKLKAHSQGRAKLQIEMRQGAAEDRTTTVEIPHWTFHDLRRTAATGMSRLGQPVHVVEAVLNHVSGTRAGVAGIYNRYSYDDEKRAALEAWAQLVADIVDGQLNKGDRADEIRA